MLNKVPDSVLEKINFQEEEIILNGSPRSLTGKIKIENNNTSTARLKVLELSSEKGKSKKSISSNALYVNTKLRAGEQRIENVSLSIAPETAPGTYENYINVGGKQRKVKMVVQPTIEIDINPSQFTVQGTKPGTKHTLLFTLTNLGNLPFQIPEVKHVAPMDMDLLCRAMGYGFRQDKEEGFTKTMDHVTRNIKENLPSWANAKVRAAGKILAVAKSMLVHMDITIPRDADEKNDYDLLIRFWDQDISVVFKSHTAS